MNAEKTDRLTAIQGSFLHSKLRFKTQKFENRA
jgi:hypothetical protein